MAKSKAAPASITTSAAAPPPLAWPVISPPRIPLAFESLSDDSDLLIIDSFLDRQSLKTWSTFLPTIKLLPSPPAKRGEAHRTNDRFGVQAPAFADALWTNSGLKELCENGGLESGVKGRVARGLNSNIRVYKYSKGAVFGPHYDDDYFDSATGWKSEWTLLVYLMGVEDGVVGGETAFYPSAGRKGHGPAIVVPLQAGRALLHRHGASCMLHEGRTVEKGVKWVLRSDVMFG